VKYNFKIKIAQKILTNLEMSGDFKMNLRKIPISAIEKASIVRDLIKIFNEFEKKYKAAFLLRDLIENVYQSAINQRIDEIKRDQTLISYEIFNDDGILTNLTKKKKDKDELFKKIRIVAENHYIFYFEFFLKLFKVILDICDFLKGGTIDEIANSHGFSPKYATSIAKIVFSGNSMNVQYKYRFFRHCDLKEIVLSIAENVKNNNVTKRSFANLKNSYIQELLMRYHKVRESENLNSDSMVVGLDLNFIERVSNLSDNKLKSIINSSVEKLTNTDLLVMCSEINKDQEILKYIVFSLMKTSISESIISMVSGKSEDFIQDCERLLYDEKIAYYD